MKYIDEVEISEKVALVRVDFNVPLSPGLTVDDDQRIKASIPTIRYLLDKRCKVVLISHLGRPEGIVNKLSLKPVAVRLGEIIEKQEIKFIEDISGVSKKQIEKADESIFLLENIRFYKEEQENDPEFSKKLSYLGDIFVNDAFSVSHRADSSVVGITELLPSYGGLLLKKELKSLERLLNNPEKPFVAILGGSKISSKLGVIEKLSDIVSTIIVGGGIANTLLASQEKEVGKSIYEKEMLGQAKDLLKLCTSKGVEVILPKDVIVGEGESRPDEVKIKPISQIEMADTIFDIGPETQSVIKETISKARTVVWNGPVGYFENPTYKAGTDAVYEAITNNLSAFSVVGGGDTLSYLADKTNNNKISFISTGGGAMLDYLTKGSLPGIDALN